MTLVLKVIITYHTYPATTNNYLYMGGNSMEAVAKRDEPFENANISLVINSCHNKV